ncbi:MAG TPA: copper amine oxidase N-terminal domain-containing protein [Firmicutes bacterium]|nr:copper amine oxidase N-terminal domain-containing protein [Bacillota bacterium]
MKKRQWTAIIAATVFLLSLGTLVYGKSHMKLFINGEEVKTKTPPQIVAEDIIVSLRDLAEAFGAQVEWDEENNSVFIDGREQESLKTKVGLLEKALAPKSPLAAVEAWAEGVKTRNGAWQYAVLSPELREEQHKRFAEANWSTGTSSPWVESYQVLERYRIDQEVYRYEVKFTYTDSAKKTSGTKEYVTVRKYEDSWLISSIEQVEVEGEITKIILGEDAKAQRIFVKGKERESLGYDQADVIIDSKTKIYRGYTDQELTVEDLQKGAEVRVDFTADPRIMIYPVSAKAEIIRVLAPEDVNSVVYENNRYNFTFTLPENWVGYQIEVEEWTGEAVDDRGEGQAVETGALIKIRHPLWTSDEPRQDIPIIVCTLAQWEQIQEGKFRIGAAPMGPKELGRNSKYVFALPARYNYAFPTGYEEVERILEKDPLKPLKDE